MGTSILIMSNMVWKAESFVKVHKGGDSNEIRRTIMLVYSDSFKPVV